MHGKGQQMDLVTFRQLARAAPDARMKALCNYFMLHDVRNCCLHCEADMVLALSLRPRVAFCRILLRKRLPAFKAFICILLHPREPHICLIKVSLILGFFSIGSVNIFLFRIRVNRSSPVAGAWHQSSPTSSMQPSSQAAYPQTSTAALSP